MRGVALTSLWIAARRAIESERPDRLFADPFARTLAGDEGFAVLAASQRGGVLQAPSIEVRTRFLDDAVRGANLGQVVILAAGMDARAFRLPLPAVLEVDQPEVIAYKEARLGGAVPRGVRRTVAIDLREDWPAAMCAAGFDENQPAVWLAEGLLPYLHAEDVTLLLARIDALSRPGSVLLFDTQGQSSLASPVMKPLLDFVASLGAPWQFGTDEPETLLEPFGWDVQARELSTVGHELGRWPYPAIPRGTPGAPQAFLVRARKR
jgi:methyltransferase (TIGR00027 family)